MVTADELDALLVHIAQLEAAVTEQAERIERLTIQREGAKAVSPRNPAPPGYTHGNAGQLVLADHAEIYWAMHEAWPSPPAKRHRNPD
jgi:hypothetical protein